MRFLDFIRDRARYYNCPVCGRSLRDCEMRLVRHVEDRYTVQVTCGACQVRFLVILAVQGGALEAEDLALEADAAEEAAGSSEGGGAEEPIQADEVLDVHLLLREFSGRLTDLVRQPSGDRH